MTPGLAHRPLAPTTNCRLSEMDITNQITDPDSPLVQEALTRTCDQCRAPVGVLCVKRGGIQQDLLGRQIHIGRMSDK